MLILGIMSGTSLDGIDYCLSSITINNKYDFNFNIIDSKTYNYSSKIKKELNEIIYCKSNSIYSCNNEIGKAYNQNAISFLKNRKIDLIAMHGQTIAHIDKINSVQIGNPAYLFKTFDLPVYYNFRSNDILNGGNGAPLVPFLDWLLFKDISKNATINLNIGGISNISVIFSNSNLTKVEGCDVGPGMTLIDKYVKKTWRLNYDLNGMISRKGNIKSSIVEYISTLDINNYGNFSKSLSTQQYSWNFIENITNHFHLESKYDILRSLVYYTAKCISTAIKNFNYFNINTNVNMYVSGGGAHNLTLIEDLNNNLKNIKVTKLNYKGINADNKESFLMCLMGITSHLKIFNNVPNVTGARKEIVCGELYE